MDNMRGQNLMQLMPHFGGTKMPQRWFKPVRGSEKLDIDDADNRGDFASPIFLAVPKENGQYHPI